MLPVRSLVSCKCARLAKAIGQVDFAWAVFLLLNQALEATEPADVSTPNGQGDPVRSSAFHVLQQRKRETRRFVASVMIKTAAQQFLRNAQQVSKISSRTSTLC